MDFPIALRAFDVMTEAEKERVLTEFAMIFRNSGATWTPKNGFVNAVLKVVKS